MTDLEGVLYTLEQAVNTKRKRHIVGGILMSISLLFLRVNIRRHDIKNGG